MVPTLVDGKVVDVDVDNDDDDDDDGDNDDGNDGANDDPRKDAKGFETTRSLRMARDCSPWSSAAATV